MPGKDVKPVGVRHILALSGGKDSAALAVYMQEKYPEIELEYVFTDSGCELPETYEYLDRIRAVLNIDITVIKPEQDFDYWLKIFKGVLPSPSNRWCTRKLKLKPYEAYIGEEFVYSYIAIRADEDRAGYKNTKGNINPIYPFVDDGIVLEDVNRILNRSGLGLPNYHEWRSRSGCFFCFYQSLEEWNGLKKHHPELFEISCQYEENHSDDRIYTWIGKRAGRPIYVRNLNDSLIGSVEAKDKPKNDNKLINIVDIDNLFDESGVVK